MSYYEFFSGNEFTVPLWEVIAFVLFISACLLFGRHRLGLLGTYCFVFFWGFIFNLNKFVDTLGSSTWGVPVYALSGVFMLLIAIIGFFAQNSDNI
jgi:hypothetical protein